jgi:hypothetical protein
MKLEKNLSAEKSEKEEQRPGLPDGLFYNPKKIPDFGTF